MSVPLSFPGKSKIRWLGEEALRRYLKLKPPSFVPNREEVVHDIRKTVGGAILDPEDIISAVLDDNDFVSIGEQSETSPSSLSLNEHFLYFLLFIPNVFVSLCFLIAMICKISSDDRPPSSCFLCIESYTPIERMLHFSVCVSNSLHAFNRHLTGPRPVA